MISHRVEREANRGDQSLILNLELVQGCKGNSQPAVYHRRYKTYPHEQCQKDDNLVLAL